MWRTYVNLCLCGKRIVRETDCYTLWLIAQCVLPIRKVVVNVRTWTRHPMTATLSAPYFLQRGDFVMIAHRREFLAAGRQREREREVWLCCPRYGWKIWAGKQGWHHVELFRAGKCARLKVCEFVDYQNLCHTRANCRHPTFHRCSTWGARAATARAATKQGLLVVGVLEQESVPEPFSTPELKTPPKAGGLDARRRRRRSQNHPQAGQQSRLSSATQRDLLDLFRPALVHKR